MAAVLSNVEPATDCCGCARLTTGVYVIAGLDLMQSISTLAVGFTVLAVGADSYRGGAAHFWLYNETAVLAIIVMLVVAVISMIFSALAIRAVRECDAKLLWTYFLWKLGRLCFYTLLLVTDLFSQQSFFTALWVLVISTSVRGYMLWIVYSLHHLLKEGGSSGAVQAGYAGYDAEERQPLAGAEDI